MLSVRHILRTQIIIRNKLIHIKYNSVRLSSNSSSSDSSDSDSDGVTEYQQQTKKTTDNIDKKQKEDIDLYGLIDHLIQKSPSKQIDIKIHEKNKTGKVEERIRKAAEILTLSVGGDKEKIVSSLLDSFATLKSKQQLTEPTSESQSRSKVGSFNEESKINNQNTSETSEFKGYKDESKITIKSSSVSKMLKNEQKKKLVKERQQRKLKKQDLQINKQIDESSILKQLKKSQIQEQQELQKQQFVSPRDEPSIFKQLKRQKEGQQQELQKQQSPSKFDEPSILKQLKTNKEREQWELQKQQSVSQFDESSILKQLKESQEQEQQELQKQQSVSKFDEPSIIKQLENSRKQEQQSKKSIIKDLVKTSQIQERRPVAKKLFVERQEHERLEQEQQKQSSIINDLYQKQSQSTQFLNTLREKNKRVQERRASAEQSVSKSLLTSQIDRGSRTNLRNWQRRQIDSRQYVKRDTSISHLHWILCDNDTEELKKWDGKTHSRYNKIFCGINMTSPNTVKLDTWESCEKKCMHIIMNYWPENAFQEMIQWTEEGKLWKFPIDNEQGMDEERNIHFSEHVFLERHLTEWCPTVGPIRHFMELVCVGLSKNPYLTVQEKYDHIMWYKEFFESKNDLLKKLGIAEIAQNKEKQAQLTH
ncbi:mitochondrial ribosomal protein S31 [Augochlora pura]